MIDTSSSTNGDCGCVDQSVTTASAFTALNYHFGMLLGVDDFETEQDYHRGQLRLHDAWLHREGVVWGLAVAPALDHNELRVDRGFALDALSCVDVGQWYAKHKDDPDLTVTTNADGSVTFDGRVSIFFKACLTRPVPAIADPCEGATADTAYSRCYETVELRLLPGLTPTPPPTDPYHRLRVLFGLVQPDPAKAEDAQIAALRGTLPSDQLLAEFRRVAALDAIDLAPPVAPDGQTAEILPALEGVELPLAQVAGITLAPAGDAWKLTAATVTNERPTHVATRTIQELLCGVAESVGSGPHVTAANWTSGETTVTLTTDRALAPRSVTKDAFAVSEFHDESGWADRTLTSDPALDGAATTVTLQLDAAPTGDLVRVLARGSGAHPILGADHTPLGGGVDSVHTLS